MCEGAVVAIAGAAAEGANPVSPHHPRADVRPVTVWIRGPCGLRNFLCMGNAAHRHFVCKAAAPSNHCGA